MEVHALNVSLTEDDLNALLSKELANHKMIKSARLRVLPEGLIMNGTVRVLVDVAFESTWLLSVREGTLAVQLAQLKALGLSANILKPTLLRFVAEATRKSGGVEVQGDMILIDVDKVASQNGMNACVNLRAVKAIEGALIIEAGRLPSPGTPGEGLGVRV